MIKIKTFLNIKFHEIFYISNILSSLRFLLGIFILLNILIMGGKSISRDYLYYLILVAYLSDLFDGYFARKLNQISELGKIIDPLADKLFVLAVIIYLYLNQLISLLMVYIIIFRDLLIIFLSLIFIKKIKLVQPSNLIGKLTVFFIGVYILFRLLIIKLDATLIFYFELFVVLMILLSLFNYIRIGWQTINSKKT